MYLLHHTLFFYLCQSLYTVRLYQPHTYRVARIPCSFYLYHLSTRRVCIFHRPSSILYLPHTMLSGYNSTPDPQAEGSIIRYKWLIFPASLRLIIYKEKYRTPFLGLFVSELLFSHQYCCVWYWKQSRSWAALSLP